MAKPPPVIQAIIPARMGSKGLPYKNLREINGKSLMRIAVEKCLEVATVVTVSTEDDDIACRAHAMKASVHFRDPKLARDDVPSIDVLREAQMPDAGIILWVQCTAPLMTIEDLIIATRWIQMNRWADLVVASHEFHGVLMDQFGTIEDRKIRPRQLMKPRWLVSGSVWAFRPEYLKGEMYAGTVVPFQSSNPTYCDINTIDDLNLARRILSDEGSNTEQRTIVEAVER